MQSKKPKTKVKDLKTKKNPKGGSGGVKVGKISTAPEMIPLPRD